MEQKRKKKIPVWLKIVLIPVVVVILAAGGLIGKTRYEQGIMEPLATGEVIPGVYAVNNEFVNFYLVQSGDDYLMIDAGNQISQTQTALAELGISTDAVKIILLTHSDIDHIRALSLFPEAQVYLPALEVQMIDGTVKRSPMGYNQMERSYTTLADGEEISLLDYHIRCISTPGHTPGSMSFLLDDRYLFVGDSMRLKDGKAILFNSLYNMDGDLQQESIRKLAADIQPEYIFTAHYGYSDDPDTVYAGWR